MGIQVRQDEGRDGAASRAAGGIERLTLVSRLTEELARRIVSGALAPGERLRQDHLAAEFGASHVPVREAFRRLEARGLIVSEPRRGVRVAPIDAESVIEVAEMRAVLEGLALRQAAARMSSDEIENAARLLDEGAPSSGIADWEETNRRFHRALVVRCAMPRLIAAIDDLHRASARFLFAAWRDLGWKGRSDEEHRAILVALRERDAERASALLSRHIRGAAEALVAVMREQGAGPATRRPPRRHGLRGDT